MSLGVVMSLIGGALLDAGRRKHAHVRQLSDYCQSVHIVNTE